MKKITYFWMGGGRVTNVMGCVSAAIIDSGDKPPCATGWVHNRIVIIARKCSLFHVFKIIGYVLVKFKVMFSVPQNS
jgi:hypothetical protein